MYSLGCDVFHADAVEILYQPSSHSTFIYLQQSSEQLTLYLKLLQNEMKKNGLDFVDEKLKV